MVLVMIFTERWVMTLAMVLAMMVMMMMLVLGRMEMVGQPWCST